MIHWSGRSILWMLALGLAILPADASADVLRPPAVPLVACDPYFSVWSRADRLTDVETTHWTGKPHRLRSLVRIDQTAYRVMGAEPTSVPVMEQVSLAVLPTRTVYNFQAGGVALTLTFLTPALPDDLDLLSRPVTYLTYTARATDGKPHEVQLYFDAAAELAVNTPDQQVTWKRDEVRGLATLQIGSTEQAVLAKKGDDIRIDWGYLYVAAPKSDVASYGIGNGDTLRSQFVAEGIAGGPIDETQAAAAAHAAALVLPLGQVGAEPVSHWLMLAYDDLYSIQYMKQNLRPYWRRNGWDAADLLQVSAREYQALQTRCREFDQTLMTDLRRAGGENYAMICGLAFRQCFAAGKFVADATGQPLQFCKENHSNGCIGTSDVFYPMAPQFLLFGPTLAKSFLVPFMNYAASDRWKFPFAPHDLGQYPHANGQRYGGGERSEKNQMPVEESGNLLILMAAVSQMEGNADFAGHYWPQLQEWAEYLKAKGFDPENQLCTDDFAGHLAHNVNLSAKAICGLGAFAKMCEMRGDAATAAEYRESARAFAAQWVKAADDGDHFRLAFDRPGTWSQKYNLVWDQILGLDLFPDEVLRKEMEFYRRIQNRYGLPLDNRQTYTKLDWILWTATLTQNRQDFQSLVDPVFRFLNETPDRVPMTDWYFTDTGRRRGFTARPVVGGVFLQMLYDREAWARYRTVGGNHRTSRRQPPAPSAPPTPAAPPADDQADAVILIDAANPGIRISDTMWGLFFEEINFAGDGGIYAELVRQRDFEGQNPLRGWSLEQRRAAGAMRVDREVRLNEIRRQSLRVDVNHVQDGGSVHVVNEGYWGIPVRQGEPYSFSMFAKADERFAGKPLTASLRNQTLNTVYADAEVGVTSSKWQKLSCTLTPRGDDTDGRLVISAADAGVFWLEMVSLFPPTYKNQPNGLRPDLVQLLADLKPSFFRFPGGCFAEGRTLKDAFRFKETIGPVEERKGRRCFWGYHNTDGLGYYEYLRLAEDLGADPIFCINPGGNNGVTERIPIDELGPWLDTAVHAVEFAIGPASSAWGAQRAAMGHPEPFRCKTFYLQIGNETEFGYRDYVQRFGKYRDRVKKAYPGENVQIIADSWGLGRRQSPEAYAIDFHQYMSWGRAIADRDRYDDAPRGEPYVFKGEYAARSGSGILQALSEAVYMMGLEENGDEVILAAYAPLFGNVNRCQWHPNLIYFDNHRSMGTISYYVQQMFSQHRGDRRLPVSVEQQPTRSSDESEPMSGSIGVATWSTEAEFDDLRVVVDGKTVYENDFSDEADIADWTSNRNGQWNVVDGVLRQSNRELDARFWLNDKNWSKYTLHLRARKLGGAEGFLVMFHVENARDWVWANFAGWGNTQHAFERAEGGAKLLGNRRRGRVDTDRWYDIQLEVDGANVVAKLDGQTVLRDDLTKVNEEPEYDVYASAVTDEAAREVVIRLVNIAESPKHVTLSIDGGEFTGDGTAITLAGESRKASQSLDDPLRYRPKTTQLNGVSPEFTHEVPPCSFTILRLEQR